MRKFILLALTFTFPLLLAAQAGNFLFVENKGQIATPDNSPNVEVKYYTQKNGLKVFLTNTGIIYQWEKVTTYRLEEEEKEDFFDKDKNDSFKTETYRTDIKLIGANPNPIIKAFEPQESYLNFYLPQCPDGALNVKHYKSLLYKNIYDGIDWLWKFTDEGVKYDFIVHPGADYHQIQLQLDNVTSKGIDAKGNFIIENKLGMLKEKAPVSFNNNLEIETHFILENNILSFSVNEYNPNETLVIDPSLIWAVYQGTTGSETANGSALDSLQNLYVAGVAKSGTTNNLAVKGYQMDNNGGEDGFITKFNERGEIVWSTYYGGSGNDYFNAIATDKGGISFVAGKTNSPNVIAHNGHQNSLGGSNDAFVAKFNDSGHRIWATYYGGQSSDEANTITIDKNSDIIFGGGALSTNNIAYNGFKNTIAGSGFFAKLDSSGARIWGSYFEGAAIAGLTTDDNNDIFFVGSTNKKSLGINTYTHQNTINGDYDAYLAKFDKDCNSIWGTFYGGSKSESASDVSVDKFGNIFITGMTISKDGIYHKGFIDSSIYNSPWTHSHFLVMFDKYGFRKWGTYYSNSLYLPSIARDNNGGVILAGTTVLSSDTLIFKNGFTDFPQGIFNGYIAQFDSVGTRLWGSYFGGAGFDFINSINFADNTNTIYVAGETESDNAGFGTNTSYAASQDILIGKIELDFAAKNDSTVLCNKTSTSITDKAPSSAYTTYWFADSTSTNPIFIGENFNFTTNGDTSFWVSYIQTQLKDTSKRGKKVITVIPAPATDFSINDSSQCLFNNKVAITNINTDYKGIKFYNWDFGDGFTSTDSTPSHTYSKDSSYKIKLFAGTQYNCSATIEKIISINPHPEAIIDSASKNQEFCLKGNEINLVSNSTITKGAVNHIWFFGDGNNASASSLKHSYQTENKYTIQLIALSDKGCTDTTYTTANILPSPALNTILGESNTQRNTQQSYYILSINPASQYTWSVDGGTIKGVPSVDSVQIQWGLSNTGIVYLFEENEFNCADTVATKYISLLNTGINSIENINYSVYPIPTNNQLQLEVNEQVNYQLTDLLGKTVATGIAQPITPTTINTTYFADGVYLLILSKNNTTLTTQKVIIKH